MASFSRRALFGQAGTGLAVLAFSSGSPGAGIPAQESPGSAPASGCGSPYRRDPVTFLVHRVGTDHAEGVTVIDMNGDGRPDICSGAYWYENPRPGGGPWRRSKYRELAPLPPPGPDGKRAENNAIVNEFVADNGEFAIDVNHDGAPDLVTSSWQNDGVWWFENPRKPNEMWKPHFICHSRDTEGMAMADIDGDGHPEVLAAHYGHQGLLWISFAGPEPAVHYVGSHEQDGHGCGVADVDGDGQADILSIHGWFRNLDAARDRWEWHPEWELGDCGFPILGYDVNGDGKTDLIFGHGHDYGLWWLEQTTQKGRRAWRRHLIDDSFSQAHALALADVDGDGSPELITGKRYRGHNGNDPGSYDPLCLYYYKIDRARASFSRYTISYNGTAEAGTQFVLTDLDGDGDLDIVCAGKTGVHWLESLRVNRVPGAVREKELLLNTDWPFPGEAD